MFRKAEADELSTGMMDHKGDYTLNRYITFRVPSAVELQAIGQRRGCSLWPILPFEQEIYGDLDSLCHAYADNPNASIRPITLRVDLAQAEGTLDVDLKVGEDVIGA